jgi:predicted NBD/HSP70 family sugar kinase
MLGAGKPSLLRSINRSRVLDALAIDARLSRADLAKRTGLAKPTVGSIVDDLLADGTLREVGLGPAQAAGGRRPMLLELDPLAAAFVGVHFGVHTTRVVVADATRTVRASAAEPAVVGSPARSVRSAGRLVDRALARSGLHADRLHAAGVAVPGPVRAADGVCTLAPNLGWNDVPIEAQLTARLGVPVRVRNIAHAAALAEHTIGAARGTENLVWLYVGTGVGAGVIVDGHLFEGAAGQAGEIGHCPMTGRGPSCSCGRQGCLEALGSGAAIAGRAGTADAERAGEAASGGDRAAQRAFREAGGWLGRGAATLVNLFDPELVVVGGGVAKAGERLLAPLRASLEVAALRPVPVVVSALGDDAEVLGALLLAAPIEREPAHG